MGRAACWAGATVMMSEHFAWILVPVTAAIVLTRPRRVLATLRLEREPRSVPRPSAPTCWWHRCSRALARPELSPSSAAYRTQADPRLGLLVNVAGLYGFFRPGPTEPKNLFSGWPAVLAALVLIVVVGYVAVLRDAAHRRDGLAMLAAGVAGYFLALGDQGPTGGLFRLAYEHLPGFVLMREPDKFAVLVALAYAYGFGWGIAWLTNRSRQKAAQVAPAALAIVLPLAYTPNLLGGLGGQVRASETPVLLVRRLAPCRAGHSAVPALARVLPDPVHRPAGDRQPGGLLLRRNRHSPARIPALVTPSLPRTQSTSSSTSCSARQWTGNGRVPHSPISASGSSPWRRLPTGGTSPRWHDAPGIRLVYSSPSLDLFSVRPTAQETRDNRRVRSVDLVDYRVLPGRPGVVAIPVPLLARLDTRRPSGCTARRRASGCLRASDEEVSFILRPVQRRSR